MFAFYWTKCHVNIGPTSTFKTPLCAPSACFRYPLVPNKSWLFFVAYGLNYLILFVCDGSIVFACLPFNLSLFVQVLCGLYKVKV